ncbi:tpr domain-containing protein [Colletotrichum incanum]|uniref:Tpr domain-containing protein n=1 Tax=Colletotrichum incanum TaxID=1573173 RepID=A0A161V5D5_COLIC|nr:tpr domain-containing protein [Colletotrichum incanum]
MPRKLSKTQRSELQSIIVSKLQGNEAITDAEIAREIVPCSTRTIRDGPTQRGDREYVAGVTKPAGKVPVHESTSHG